VTVERVDEPAREGDARLMRLLAHETRTPLNAIRGFTELLLAGAAGPLRADALDHLRQIARAAQALEDALRLLQELMEPNGQGGLRAAALVDLGLILRELGFVLAGSGAPPILGDAATWRRIAAACRAYFLGRAPAEAALAAEFAQQRDGGLELVLRCPDIRETDGIGLLGLELASQLAAGQGSGLALRGRGVVAFAWPADRVVVPAGVTEPALACCVKQLDDRYHPTGEGRRTFLLDFPAADGTPATTTSK
jgi:hypothetical protein